MVQDQIEREIFINAGIDRVWSLVAKTGFWVGEELIFKTEAKAGETVVIDNPTYGKFPVRVEQLEPPRYAAYRWASGFPDAELTGDNTTLVEFTLAEQNGGVLVRVKESGFAAVPGSDDFRRRNRDSNVEGWPQQLEKLRLAVEGVLAP